MAALSNRQLRHLSLATLLATLAVTGVHHVFRLGPELIVPVAVGVVLPIVLLAVYRRTGRRAALIAYAVYAGLIVFWFGFLDGFLDHTVKAVGLDNITFLPGSNAEVIATVYSLWSEVATTRFYEWTGVASAALALATLVSTSVYLLAELTPDGSRHRISA
ncbi:MAG: hypothetical protein JWN11_1032 [Hyphomicrobiales bacterium]|nr:hypothetical protein [Hyphomicrobiales bacterium]